MHESRNRAFVSFDETLIHIELTSDFVTGRKHILKYGLDWISKKWTGLIKDDLIKHGLIKQGFIKQIIIYKTWISIKRGLIKLELIRLGLIKHGLIKHRWIRHGLKMD